MAEVGDLTLARDALKLSISPSEESYVLLAAIDFGTTFSGYAFSFKSQPEDIKINKEWGNEVGIKSYKTPTCILTDDNDKFVAFGYEAMNTYAREVDSHKRFHLYDRFKMSLYHEKVIGSKTTIISRGGRSLPAETVISMALNFMYNHILKAIKDADAGEIEGSLIRWVLTVPAIWSEGAKQLMRRAAFKAGIIDSIASKRLLIALEPEAASFWCRKIPMKQFAGSDDTTKALPEDAKYMVVDCGGGTIDITVHQITPTGVKEIHRANGGAWGGTKVDENFLKLMDDLLGVEFTKMYQRKYPQDWLNLLVSFETVKRSFSSTQSKSINISLSYNLGDIVEEELGKSLKKVIKDAQLDGVSFSQGMLVLEPRRVQMIFNPVVSAIVDHIKDLSIQMSANDVNYVFLVGGFSECKVLSKRMRAEFGSSRNILVPHDAGMCVMKGAVLYGHQPRIVVSRIARVTIGEGIMANFIEGVHDASHKNVVDGRERCEGLFRTWVKMNESVSVGSFRTFTSTPHEAMSTSSITTIFSVERENVTYVTEKGVQEIGEIRIDIPDKHLPYDKREIKTHVFFGDTEMHVRVEDGTRPDGDIGETTINFSSE